jgi:hypothetical protein
VSVNEPGDEEPPDANEIGLRLAIGLAQMIGAVVCVAMLLSGAPLLGVVALALLTTGLAAFSRSHWRRR